MMCDVCLDLLLGHCSVATLNSVPFASDGQAKWEDVVMLKRCR